MVRASLLVPVLVMLSILLAVSGRRVHGSSKPVKQAISVQGGGAEAEAAPIGVTTPGSGRKLNPAGDSSEHGNLPMALSARKAKSELKSKKNGCQNSTNKDTLLPFATVAMRQVKKY